MSLSFGKAFGFHRSMDTVGAVIGPVLAFVILGIFSVNFEWVFRVSIIPDLFALFCIAIFVKDVKKHTPAERPVISLRHFNEVKHV